MTIDINALRTRFDHESAKESLREKYQAKMIFAYAGGMWQAGSELLTLLKAVEKEKTIVLLDLYRNPILINVKEFKNLVLERWQEQMNLWHSEYQKLLHIR